MSPTVRIGKKRVSRLLLGGLFSRDCCEFGARGSGEVGAGVGVTAYPPAALGRLGEQDPGALLELGVSGGSRDDLGKLVDNPELLVAVENADWGEDLDAD